MPHRAQRRRNREAREAPAREAAKLNQWLDYAEEKLGIRREFVAEAIRSRGLVSLTFRPRGEASYLDLYGGVVTTDGTSSLRGDGIVNDWRLPLLKGYRVWYSGTASVIARLDPTFKALDVSDVWLKTADELHHPTVSVATEGNEEHITITRDGLTVLSRSIGQSMLSRSLEYVEAQLFDSHQPASVSV